MQMCDTANITFSREEFALDLMYFEKGLEAEASEHIDKEWLPHERERHDKGCKLLTELKGLWG